MSSLPAPPEQLALLRSAVRGRRPKPVTGPAPERPVARVVVDLPLAHLDRPFDYVVPATMHDLAVAGCRVKVRFAGRDVDGYVIERADETSHVGQLSPLRRVVSSEPVLSPDVLHLARMVADRYAGTLADVVRLAVPPRHAKVEGEPGSPRQPRLDVGWERLAQSWTEEVGGEAWIRRLAAGEAPRAVWAALPGADWPAQLAAAAGAALAAGRGSILCVPDARDLARLDSELASVLGSDSYVTLTAELGPAARYRSFLALSRGEVQVVAGTRAAAFAPVRDLGLVAMWDDGDDALAEPRSPYPHAREVLLLRAHLDDTAALLGAVGRSVEAQALIESGWAVSVAAPRQRFRAAAPRVHITGESDSELARDTASAEARVPRRVFEVVRDALRTGPVLVHAPRYGYLPTLVCAWCRHPAQCARCTGPLTRGEERAGPHCRWCARGADTWSCPHCQATTLRAPVVGSRRTAEEWGKSFPLTPVIQSGGDHVVDEVGAEPALVIATPGAEPRAAGGYAAAVLLDTWLTLSRPDLRVAEESLRRWLSIGALVRSGPDGGRVVAVGDPASAALQALVRWDPEGFALRELADRRSAGLMPATRLATITGPRAQIEELGTTMDLPDQVDVLGPVELQGGVSRLVVRIERSRGPLLSRALQRLQASRSSRKLPALRVQVDPVELE